MPEAAVPLSPRERGRGEGSHKLALPPDLLAFARELRNHQTDAEDALWYMLRDRRMAGTKFRRQHPVEPYVLDFYCHELKLAIELDGGQHNHEYDERRSAFLARKGIRVLRFWNNDVFQQTEAVLEAIYHAITTRIHSSQPQREKGSGRQS